MSPKPISTDEMMGAVPNPCERSVGGTSLIPRALTPKPGGLEGPEERISPSTSDSELQSQQPSSSTTETLLGDGGRLPPSPNHGYGTLIPNRVFVGGISTHTTESELAGLFSKFGAVRGAKIILDRAGISKGYGFVTFETEEEARRLFIAMNNRELPPIVHRDRRLNIAPAVKKQPVLRQSGASLYGSSSTTVSPPPSLEPFYFPGASASLNPGEFLLPPPPPHGFPSHDFLYPHPNPFSPFFPSAATGASANPTATPGGSGGVHQSGLGLGQALPGPNGTIIFLPLGLPIQQQPQSFTSADFWNGVGVGAGSNLASFAGLPPLPPNHGHQFGPWSAAQRMAPHHYNLIHQGSLPPPPHSHGGGSIASSGAGTHSSSTLSSSGSQHHHGLNLNNSHGYLGGDPLTNGSAEQLLYFSNALISSPH